MEELTRNASTVNWWLSVVIVGVLLNLVSAYLKQGVDYFLKHTSEWWRARSARSRQRYDEEISALRQSADLRQSYQHRELTLKVESLFLLIFALLLYLSKAVTLVVPEFSIARDLGVSVEQSNKIFYSIISFLIILGFRLQLKGNHIADRLSTSRVLSDADSENAPKTF